jgi:serine protease Do
MASEATPEQPAASVAAPSGSPGDFRRVFTTVARKTVPGVVSIVTEKQVAAPGVPFDFFGGKDPFQFFFGPRRGPRPEAPAPQHHFQERGLGSGFVVSAEGYVLTNNHVVEGARSVKVHLSDESDVDAKLVGTDKATDLAVLKIEGKLPPEVKPLRLGDSDKLQIGEWVVAVGAPFGLYESVTTGIISAKGRADTGLTAYGNFLQTDAAINPGNSGGPLVNLDGEVVGINTAILSHTGGYQGVGFAIPAKLAKGVMDSIVEHGKVIRGWLGVSIQSISPALEKAMGLSDRKGALVGDVLPDGPAKEAGVQRGDIIVSLGGKEVADAKDLMNQVALVAPGTTVELGIVRDGKKTTAKVRVGKRDEQVAESAAGGGSPSGEADISKFGFEVSDLSDQAREQYGVGADVEAGAVIVDVAPDGLAAEAGLREGDVVVEVNQEPVHSASEVGAAVRSSPAGKGILFLVSRKGNTFYVVLQQD